MESRRALGLLIAVIATFLVIIAGRSCTKSTGTENGKSKKSAVIPTDKITVQMATNVPGAADTPQTPPDAPEPDTLQQEDPTAPPDAEPDTNDIPAASKSKLDEFWDSEHPSYLDPYGFLDGGYQSPSSVHIDIN